MSNRRKFIKTCGYAGVSLIGLKSFALSELPKDEMRKVSILHTNDTHSRIDPFPTNHKKYAGRGGAAQRATLIKKIRAEEENILLLDAGDIFQGTPYFNMFHGNLEMKLMSLMSYDASTIGNHEFDLGMDGFVKAQQYANFPFVNCNYDFTDTPMHESCIPYKVFEKSGLRIGVLGVGIELEGLVDAKLYEGVRYSDPIQKAQEYTNILRGDENCDLVICLSHLGYEYESKSKVSDRIIGKEVQGLDLIIGGHTHTFLEGSTRIHHKSSSTLINQVGWAGLNLGKVDFFFGPEKSVASSRTDNRPVLKDLI